MFYEELFAALADHRVAYAVVGGLAVNLHGIPRMTYDVDIVCTRTSENLTSLGSALGELGLKAREPLALESFGDLEVQRVAREERNMLALTFTDSSDPLREVDVLVATAFDAEAIVERAEARKWNSLTVRIASLDDLVQMKTNTGRAQDEADVLHLQRLRGGP